ncbi:MAG: hypothetical protein ACM3MI_14975 [Clostridiales bacterium]
MPKKKNEDPQNKQMKFKVDTIKIPEFHFTDMTGKTGPACFKFTINDLVSFETKSVKTTVILMLIGQDEPEERPLISLTVEIFFDITNFDEVFVTGSKKLPFEVMNFFHSFSLSFARGVLYEKTSGILAPGMFFPLVDTAELLKNAQVNVNE